MATTEEGVMLQFSVVTDTDGTFAYKDFVPSVTEESWTSHHCYEDFSVLVNRANEWLARHPEYRVKTCESVEVILDANKKINPDQPQFTEYGKQINTYVRFLRLWFINTSCLEPQQIGYMTIVPECLDEGGLFTERKYENYAQTLDRLNEILRDNPLPGRVLNVETQDMKIKSTQITAKPEVTFWWEKNPTFLVVIRVFYERGPSTFVQLGSADFLPEKCSPTRRWEEGTYEAMSAVVGKASSWIASQPGLNVINVQSLNYKMLWSAKKLDTLRTRFYDGNFQRYTRILRVIYGKIVDTGQSVPRSPLNRLNYKTFLPLQLTRGKITFESFSETMSRARAWLTATGAKVLGAETVELKLHQNMNKWHTLDPEVTVILYSATDNYQYWLLALRLYLDGIYQEPPPEVLPPEPVVQYEEPECCTLV